MNKAFRPLPRAPEMPKAANWPGMSSGSCAFCSARRAWIILVRLENFAPPASARNSRRRENHITTMVARMDRNTCAAMVVMK